MKYTLLIMAIIALASCTQNEKVKSFGGEATINLPLDQKLVNVTWKENNLWYLTKPMNKKDSAESYEFKEQSGWGILNGTYFINEQRSPVVDTVVVPEFNIRMDSLRPAVY